MGTPRPPARPRTTTYLLGFWAIALLVLVTAAMLPFAVGSALDDFAAPTTSRVYQLLPTQPPAPQHLRVHLIVADIDIIAQTATVQVAAHQVCPDPCTNAYALLLISTWPEGPDGEGVPPSATIAIPPGQTEVSTTVTLPLEGRSIRYPFDTYELGFGVVLERVSIGGTRQPVEPAEVSGDLFVSLQTKVQSLDMTRPRLLTASSIPVVGDDYPFLTIRSMAFARPFYLKVLTVLLVLLIAIAAAYAVFIRPIDDLVVNIGALAIGIWGVRAILVGTGGPPITAVDLALSVVILFLLAAFAVRSLSFLYARSGLRLLPARRSRRPESVSAPPGDGATGDADRPASAP